MSEEILSSASSGADSLGAAEMSADLDAMDFGGDEGSESTPTESADTSDPDPAESLEADIDAALDAPDPIEEEADAQPDPEPEKAEEPEPAKDENGEELPEGVTVREKNGKREYVLREGRYQAVYGGYKAAQAAEDILGEQLTNDVIQLRQDAFVNQEAMIGDFLSGEPGAEGRFIQTLAHWSKLARENGEVQHDPLNNIASKLPEFLIKSGNSEAYQAMAAPVLRHQLDELYQIASQPGNEDLFLSLQHVDKRLFGTFKKREQITAPDPLAQREAELTERENRIKQSDTQRQRAEYDKWQSATSEQIRAAVTEGITERLGEQVLKSYEKFPTDLQAVKTLLQSEFQAALKKDPAWQQYLSAAGRRAANATSPDVRQAITADLQARYKAKATYWADPARNLKVKEILTQRAASIKATSQAKHDRLQNGAQRREPGAVGTPVRQTVRDRPNGRSTAEDWAVALDEL